MPQQTFENGDSLASIRGKLNGNAIDGEGRFGLLETFSTFSNISDIVGQINGAGAQTILSSNANVYADGAAGAADPTGVSSGWYYKNSDTLTEKINWYYWYNNNPATTMTTATLDGNFAVVNLRSATAPFFVYYTQVEGDGNDAAIWYRSRFVYSTYADLTAYIGQDVVLYWGTDPGILPGLPRIELTLDTFATVGPQGLEDIMFGALSTSTGYPEGTYEFVVNQAGVINNTGVTTFFMLNQDVEPITNGYSDTHYVTLDASNDYVRLTTPSVEVDFNKDWSIAISLDSVSSINDSSYICLFRSGNNMVTLRKGGTNWGIYVYSSTGSVWQANTWHAPVAGSKIVIRCNSVTGYLNYYLHNAHDGGDYQAGGTMNATKRAGNAPSANTIDIGRGGTNGVLSPGYWFGGINDVVVWDEYISNEVLTEYLSSNNVTEHSYYAADVVDMVTLGEGTYPDCDGLKGAITGELINGTPEDFVAR